MICCEVVAGIPKRAIQPAMKALATVSSSAVISMIGKTSGGWPASKTVYYHQEVGKLS